MFCRPSEKRIVKNKIKPRRCTRTNPNTTPDHRQIPQILIPVKKRRRRKTRIDGGSQRGRGGKVRAIIMLYGRGSPGLFSQLDSAYSTVLTAACREPHVSQTGWGAVGNVQGNRVANLTALIILVGLSESVGLERRIVMC